MALDVELQIAVDQVGLPGSAQLAQWANAAWQQSEDAALVIRVVDDQESRDLNSRFCAKDRPTNVLSFPYERMPGMPVHHVGDLVICAPVVEREAAEQHKAVEAHWAHMVVHGVLHLQGFDHTDDNEAARMEELETDILAALGFPAPYATGELR
jgi:probable rRNA maturation factor